MTFSLRTLLCIAIASVAFTVGLAQPAPAQVDIAPGLASIYTMDAQQMLAQKGFLKGQGTGSYDKRTGDAIRAYQRAAGVPVTGVLDQRLVEQLRFGPQVIAQNAPSGVTRAKAKPHTAPASDGYVRLAQEELARLGLYKGTVDGRPGKQTNDAVLRYQAKNDLAMTGKVDAALIKQLLAGQTRPSAAFDGAAQGSSSPQLQLTPAVQAPPVQQAPAQPAPIVPAEKNDTSNSQAKEAVPVPSFPNKQPAGGGATTDSPNPIDNGAPLFRRS